MKKYIIGLLLSFAFISPVDAKTKIEVLNIYNILNMIEKSDSYTVKRTHEFAFMKGYDIYNKGVKIGFLETRFNKPYCYIKTDFLTKEPKDVLKIPKTVSDSKSYLFMPTFKEICDTKNTLVYSVAEDLRLDNYDELGTDISETSYNLNRYKFEDKFLDNFSNYVVSYKDINNYLKNNKLSYIKTDFDFNMIKGIVNNKERCLIEFECQTFNNIVCNLVGYSAINNQYVLYFPTDEKIMFVDDLYNIIYKDNKLSPKYIYKLVKN